MQTQFTELTDSQWQVIEKHFIHNRPRVHSIRTIFNAILWLTRTGSQWRNMESKYPNWQSIYYYFDQWKKDGILSAVLSDLAEYERIRNEEAAHPTTAAVDSQSVKIVPFVGQETGVDGNKKINGRKRHILVDSLGLPISIHVSAANKHDNSAGPELLTQALKYQDSLTLIRGDKAYGGVFKEQASWCDFEVETKQAPPTEKGFVPQKGRWQVERSFAWLNFYRRLSKDYEKLPQSSVAFIQLAFITMILLKI